MKASMGPKPFLTMMLGLAAALLVVELGGKKAAESTLPVAPDDGKDVVAELQPEFSLPPLNQTFGEMLNRPIFMPDRRMQETQSDSKQQPDAERLTLIGVIMVDDKKVALLFDSTSNKTLHLVEGKSSDGILLEKLEPKNATLRIGNETKQLVLKTSPNAAQLAAAGAQARKPPAPASTPATTPPPAATSDAPALPNSMQELIRRRRASHGLPAM